MDQPKRRLKIDLGELATAFEHRDSILVDYYLDLETGSVIMITEDERYLLREIQKTCVDPKSGEIDWAKAEGEHDVDDWQRDNLKAVIAAEEKRSKRYLEIPQEDSREGFNDMSAYIATLKNPYLQARLEKAIAGKGPFRAFKEALVSYPNERKRWFEFLDGRRQERARDWLEGEGIELIEGAGEAGE